ncbi:hypothetical protein FGADI_11829 [Fusarium gaditjirri]|uniref:Uncharacterized protein n=1 Tax=Fusarium gaditjirri TaxID=282569 RepID=A0A8H4WP53_9HYPO|nr:hypothetical protein FGADI_11829 [Fusarium gaditjirri]
MGLLAKIKFKLRKVRAKYRARKRLRQGASETVMVPVAEPVTHEERLAQVHRVEGTEHRIEPAVDVLVASRRSVYGAHMVPRTVNFGVTPEEARTLHAKQAAEDAAKASGEEKEAIPDGANADADDNRI